MIHIITMWCNCCSQRLAWGWGKQGAIRPKFKEALTLRFVHILTLTLILIRPILLNRKPRFRKVKCLASRWQGTKPIFLLYYPQALRAELGAQLMLKNLSKEWTEVVGWGGRWPGSWCSSSSNDSDYNTFPTFTTHVLCARHSAKCFAYNSPHSSIDILIWSN